MLNNSFKKITLVMLLTSATVIVTAQGMKEKVADKKFALLSFLEAGEMYSELAEKTDATAHQIRRAAESNMHTGNTVEAERWYTLLADKSMTESQDLINFAQILKMNGKYDKAGQILKSIGGSNSIVMAHQNAGEYWNTLKKNTEGHKVSLLQVNSASSDFAPSYYSVNGVENLVFASARSANSSLFSSKSQWDGEDFTDMYMAEIGGDGEQVRVSRFETNFKSRYHEGPVSFSNNGSVMYLTRSNFLNGKKGQDAKRINNLKLFISTKDANGDWSDLVSFVHNSDDYSVGHASVSEDGKLMYFASDMPGSKGETDIWMSTLVEGSWSKPVNVKSINTEGKELFPFLSKKGNLYFSSNGFVGLGGLDIFMAKGKNGEFGEPQNMRFPINTNSDDFGLITGWLEDEGYFTSNRKGETAKGGDDIYRFTISTQEDKVEEEISSCSLVGQISDLKTGTGVQGASVKLRDQSSGMVQEFITNEKGEFEYLLEGKPCPGYEMNYDVIISKKGYLTKSLPFNKTFEKSGAINLNEFLNTSIQNVSEGSEIAEFCNIDAILYDLNKSSITKQAMKELDKLVECMNANKSIKVEIGSHTDCRASDSYNQSLSNKRAKSAKDYVISKGISSERIFGKGYGESKLLNNCDCNSGSGSGCSEAEHQRNRRTEFRIVQ